MKEVVIASATRTCIGNFNGVLAPCSAVDLGSAAIKDACARAAEAAEMIVKQGAEAAMARFNGAEG